MSWSATFAEKRAEEKLGLAHARVGRRLVDLRRRHRAAPGQLLDPGELALRLIRGGLGARDGGVGLPARVDDRGEALLGDLLRSRVEQRGREREEAREHRPGLDHVALVEVDAGQGAGDGRGDGVALADAGAAVADDLLIERRAEHLHRVDVDGVRAHGGGRPAQERERGEPGHDSKGPVHESPQSRALRTLTRSSRSALRRTRSALTSAASRTTHAALTYAVGETMGGTRSRSRSMEESDAAPSRRPSQRPGPMPSATWIACSPSSTAASSPGEAQDAHGREIAAADLEGDARVVVDDADGDGRGEDGQHELEDDEHVPDLGADEAAVDVGASDGRHGRGEAEALRDLVEIAALDGEEHDVGARLLAEEAGERRRVHVAREPEEVVDQRRDRDLDLAAVSLEDLDRDLVAGADAERLAQGTREAQARGRERDRAMVGVEDVVEIHRGPRGRGWPSSARGGRRGGARARGAPPRRRGPRGRARRRERRPRGGRRRA